jgi:MarR family transcriptional regulator, organic hydroperoxide resistance regulator
VAELRDCIILSALDKTPGLTQAELGKTIGLDKTTLMSQLDRLERGGLVVRRSDARDRRIRIPVITDVGQALRATVAEACATVEASLMSDFGPDQVQLLRRMLFAIIGDGRDPGSCP